ncbi:hypothetical protein GCM10009753_50430 [Streptantibioticus ferralitis]
MAALLSFAVVLVAGVEPQALKVSAAAARTPVAPIARVRGTFTGSPCGGLKGSGWPCNLTGSVRSSSVAEK